MIMIILIEMHQILVGKMSHNLQCLAPRINKQHKFYDQNKKQNKIS